MGPYFKIEIRGTMDRQISPYFKIWIQGSMDRQIGPYLKIWIQGSMDRKMGPYFKIWNIFICFICSWVLFFLFSFIFSTPKTHSEKGSKSGFFIPLFSGSWIPASQLKIRTDSAVHGSLHPYLKMRTDSVVPESLYLN